VTNANSVLPTYCRISGVTNGNGFEAIEQSDDDEWLVGLVLLVSHERDNITHTKFVLVPTARCRVCGVERGCTWVYT
jgi:hypothetical protein